MVENNAPTGAEAIMAKEQAGGPLAIPMTITGSDGKEHTIYIDSETGESISDLKGYSIFDGTNTYKVNSTADTNRDGTIAPDEARQTARPNNVGGGFGSEMGGPRYSGTPTSKDSKYIDKPGWMGLTSAIPGPLGMVGKAANLAWNANNVQAANNKKTAAGKKTMGFGATVKGLITGVDEEGKSTKKGNIAERVTGLKPGWVGRALTNVFSGKAPEENNEDTNHVTKSTPTNASGVGFMSHFGPNRPNMPSSTITNAVRSEVGKTFGKGFNVVGISGQEDPGEQYGSTRHKTGLAMDFDVTDPMGNRITDPNNLSDLASNFAFDNPEAGIGYGPGYMAPGRMHLDITGQGKQWGAANTVANMNPALSETIDAARQGFHPTSFSNPGIPSARPDPTETGAFVSQDERSLDPMSHQSLMAAGPKTAAQQITANAMRMSPTPQAAQAIKSAGLSPAAMAAMGFTTRTPAEISAISRTIAGELSQKSLQAIAAGDETATAELGNMVASVENRAASTMFGTLDNALNNPSQYQSLAAANLGVTNENFAKYGPVVEDKVSAFYTGQTKPTSYHVTNYFNPDDATPDWASTMEDPTQVGAHLFGSLPEYSPTNAAESGMMAFGKMAGTNFSPGKASDDDTTGGRGYSGGGTGTTYGGRAGQSGGAGYSPGGLNSPSGSGFGTASAFGGSNSPRGMSTPSSGGARSSFGGSNSPRGMGSSTTSSSSSFGGSNSPRGMGSSTAGKSSTSKGGGYSTGASKGSTGGL